jgi:thiamine-monophosphate kinase
MIDISDGVFGDLGHIIRASQVGAEIMLSKLPLSPAYRRYAASNGDDLWEWALTGGEDYELCFTADAADSETILKLAKTAGIPATIIGTVTDTQIIQCIDSAGGQYLPRRHSYTHF